MAKTVVSFAPKQIVRAGAAPYRTERYVSRLRVFERVAALLDRISVERRRRIRPRGLSASSLRAMRKLAGELEDPSPSLRILCVVEWYERHCEDKYIPWVEGGETLYEKFDRLEARMRDQEGQISLETVDEIVARLFNGSRVLTDSFRSDVLGRARSLDLGGASESIVAANLGGIYQAIRAARSSSSTSEGILGPLTLLERYVGWLGEKRDWQMTTRVLSVDSPAFNQFRREQAARHPHGADPVTGRRSGE